MQLRFTHLFLARLACLWSSLCDSVIPTGSKVNSLQGAASGGDRLDQDSIWQLTTAAEPDRPLRVVFFGH